MPILQHTITGVSTALTAFVGPFLRGQIGVPQLVSSLEQFQEAFGGVDPASPVTYAVSDFFENGGHLAVLVRIYKAPIAEALTTGTATGVIGGVQFHANSPGAWGNHVAIAILAKQGSAQVTVTYTPDPANPRVTVVEQFQDLTLEPTSPRRIDVWINANSQYVTIPSLPAEITDTIAANLRGGCACAELDDAAYDDSQFGYQATLEKAFVFNLLYLPPPSFKAAAQWPAWYPGALARAAAYCQQKAAFLIADPDPAWTPLANAGNYEGIDPTTLGITGPASAYAAVYFPPPDLGPGTPTPCPVGGIVAGIMAATDASRGVWKAPAGLEAAIACATGVTVDVSDVGRSVLNAVGINSIRASRHYGVAIWGARTLNGQDVLESDYKYVNVRRLTNYLEQSLRLGTQWAVFEPNDEALWSSLRLALSAFLSELWRQGAFAGTSASDAFRVTVDSTTTTPEDQRVGSVNVVVAFAPVYPAEFVVLYLQQATMPVG